MFYLYKFLYPWPLVLFYGGQHLGSIFNPINYLNVLVFLGLLALLWIFRRNRLFIFSFIFYFSGIFFLLRFHPFFDLVSDRYMYLPSIGLCMFLAVSIEKMFFWAQDQGLYLYILKMAMGALVVFMGVTTWRQCEVWQSSVKLWSNQLKYGPDTAMWLVYCKLANAYAQTAKEPAFGAVAFNQACTLYQKSIHVKPDFAEAYFGMGDLWGMVGDWQKAEKYYKLAALYEHKDFEEFFKLGKVYQEKKIPQKAIGFYRRAMAADPYLCPDIKEAYDDSIQRHESVKIYQGEISSMPNCR